MAPWLSDVTQAATMRHSAFVQPWTDQDIHLHADSEEYYFVFHWQLQLLVWENFHQGLTWKARRALQSAWGSRAPLTQAHYQNCWLFGVGQARLDDKVEF